MDRIEVFEKIRHVLREVLGVDASEVKLDSTLITDLGAESIDFLDIVFRLEKSFSVTIPAGELFPDKVFWEQVVYVPEFCQEGRFTPRGLVKIQDAMPRLDLSVFRRDPVLHRLADCFTVDYLVNYIDNRLSTAVS